MRALIKYLKEYKLQSILAPFFKLLEACFELLVPIVVASIIDNGIKGNRGMGYVTWMCLLLVAFAIVGLVSAVAAQYFAAKSAVGFSKGLRADLFRKLQSLSYRDFDNIGTSKMITRMTSDVNQLQSGVNLLLRLFMRSPFIVFGAMIMAFIVDTQAGIVFSIIIAILSIIIFGIMFITMPFFKKSQARLDAVALATKQNLTGIRVIRAFCKEQEEVENYSKINNGLYRAQTMAGFISSLMNPLTYVVINIGIIILIKNGAIKVEHAILTQGQIIALYNYMSQILVELIKLANLIITITKSFACAGRVSEILNMDTSLKYNEGQPSMETISYITFANASVNYGGAVNALNNISFNVERGQTIGIIGGTGSGKTTLINLLMHFYDCTDGGVFIEGRNVNTFSSEELIKKIGLVPQKAVLFKGTIRDNLKWGNENATDDEIMKAVEIAQAKDVIFSKSNGLDEEIEQGGKNLSGGQRQRLTIARALVKCPEILILDDSSSALDYATDLKLRQAIYNIDYKPTVFIISQRTSSILNADKIIILDDGKMIACGTHEQLLISCQEYAEIHYSQFEREGE